MDYQAVRKKYTLYTRVAGIMTMLLILCVSFAVSDIPMRTGGVLVIVAGLALAIYVINKWYLTTVAKLLHVDLDLASWKQYIEANKEAKRAALRLDAATSRSPLSCTPRTLPTLLRLIGGPLFWPLYSSRYIVPTMQNPNPHAAISPQCLNTIY